MDENGNYGYIKDGADTVIPFKSDVLFGDVFFNDCGTLKGYRSIQYDRDFLNAEFKLIVYPYFTQESYNVDTNNMFLTHEKPFHNKNKLRVSFHVNIPSKDNWYYYTNCKYWVGISSSNTEATFIDGLYDYLEFYARNYSSGEVVTKEVEFDLSNTDGDLYFMIKLWMRYESTDGSGAYIQLIVDSIEFVN